MDNLTIKDGFLFGVGFFIVYSIYNIVNLFIDFGLTILLKLVENGNGGGFV